MPGLRTNDRYVPTAEIREAVRDREADILDDLGIQWRDGRPHLSCPYPDHQDRHPGWRWDSHKARAYCTCTKSDTIFDIVMKVKGVDLGAAKLWIAEWLGRADLVRNAKDKHHQRHDAVSLLNPPNKNRDDELPFVYLAARLGIDPSDVPRAATPIAGIRALEYFDPPATQRAKPKLVGHGHAPSSARSQQTAAGTHTGSI